MSAPTLAWCCQNESSVCIASRICGVKFLQRFAAVGFRMLTPKWAHAPTSGAGAALHGGRANRPGFDAVYVSTEAQTAIAEYQQLSPLMPPGNLVSFEISIGLVVGHQRHAQRDGVGGDPFVQRIAAALAVGKVGRAVSTGSLCLKGHHGNVLGETGQHQAVGRRGRTRTNDAVFKFSQGHGRNHVVAASPNFTTSAKTRRSAHHWHPAATIR